MLTKCRIEKILGLVKKEYDYMDNKPIHITTTHRGTWGAETTAYDYTLNVNKNFNDDDFTEFFYQYLAEEFNFDLTWAKVDYKNTMNALILLHEIGHILQTMDIVITEDWCRKINKIYSDFRNQSILMNEQERLIAYRKIPYEYLSDEFAVKIFSKYAVKILAILNGTTQKEIKSRLTEAKKGVA